MEQIKPFAVIFVIPTFLLGLVLASAFSAGASATVTVLSPNGGECFVVGETIGIQWSMSTQVYDVEVSVRDTNTNAVVLIAHTNPGATSAAWIAPLDLKGKPLKIMVNAHDSAHAVIGTDESDNVFGIADSCSTSTNTTAPNAPTNLAASAISSTRIDLSWTDNSANESGFKVYRKFSSESTWPAFSSYLARLDVNAMAYSDTSVSGGKSYDYRLYAYNDAGFSSPAEVLKVATPTTDTATDDTLPPALVSGPQAGSITSSSATISWGVNEPAFPQVFYGSSNILGSVAASSQTTSSELQTVSLTGLLSGTEYWYQIRSCDASGNCFVDSTVYNFKTIAEAGAASISGIVRDSNGSALANIIVAAGDTQIRYEATTNTNGAYQLSVAAGTWNVGVKTQRDGYFNPPIQVITIASGAQRTGLDFQYQSDTTGVAVTGTVRLFGGPVLAHVWAREGLNRFKDAGTDASGNFSLVLLPNLEWHIGAGAYRNGVCYNAAPIAVTPQAGTTVTLDLVSIFCPEKQEQQHDAQQDYAANLDGGASFAAPAGAFGTSGTVTVTVAPDPTAPDTQDSSIIGVAYRIEVRKTDGSLVQALNELAHLSLPYSEEVLSARGATAQGLQLALFDETQKRWARIAEATLDENTKRMHSDVSHLTRFALVSAADTVPPQSPSGVRIVRAGSDALNVHWVNPTTDFHHIKVYRSTTQGQLGDLILDNFPGSSWRDSGLQNGVRYYYNAKAVDPAGNISTVDLQTSNVPADAIEGGVREGDLVRGSDGIKVYIVNANGFKRHIFNPAVFGMYRHFSWGSIKNVSQDVADSFITSDLYRAVNDYKVYSLLEINEAQGLAQKRWFDITAQQFIARFLQWEQVFEVNAQERDYYQEGTPIQ